MALRQRPIGAQYFRRDAVVYGKNPTIVTIFLQNDNLGAQTQPIVN